jgi:hypothetical protein
MEDFYVRGYNDIEEGGPKTGPKNLDALVFAFQTNKMDQEDNSWADYYTENHYTED